MGSSIFYPYRGMNIKIQRVPLLWFFLGVFISRYIFPGDKFAEFTFFTYSGMADSKLFRYHFFWWIKLSKIKFQIYKSNNDSFQGVLVFKNLVTPLYMDKKWNSPLKLYYNLLIYPPICLLPCSALNYSKLDSCRNIF